MKGSVAFGLGLGYLALGVASLVPGPYRPSTVSVLATRFSLQPAWLASVLAVYAGVLEICQALIPGRVVSVEDFLASMMGAVIGISIATLSRHHQRLVRRRAR